MNYSIKITTTNRNAARKLLTNWYPATDVRVWKLAELEFRLHRAVNEGLITLEGVRRALESDSTAYGNGRDDSSNKESDNDDGDSTESEESNGGDGEESDGESDDDGEESESDGDDGTESEQDNDGEESEQDSDGESNDDDSNSDDNEKESDNDDDNSDDDNTEESEENSSDEESESEESESDDDAQQESESESEEQPRDYHEMLPTVEKYINAGLNVALVGPAGTGKSTIVSMIADRSGKELRGCGALLSKYELTGFTDAHGRYNPTPLYEAYTEGKIFCFDEFDASAPDAAVAFNAITDNQKMYAFPNGMQPKHAEFVAVCCMNTFGTGATADYVGRYKQDAAAMSRFVKVYIDYDRVIEKQLGPAEIVRRVWKLRDACESLGVRHVVSTRMITQAAAAKKFGATEHEIDRDIFFAGLDEATIKQLSNAMTGAN